jgi:hypothetical protein
MRNLKVAIKLKQQLDIPNRTPANRAPNFRSREFIINYLRQQCLIRSASGLQASIGLARWMIDKANFVENRIASSLECFITKLILLAKLQQEKNAKKPYLANDLSAVFAVGGIIIFIYVVSKLDEWRDQRIEEDFKEQLQSWLAKRVERLSAERFAELQRWIEQADHPEVRDLKKQYFAYRREFAQHKMQMALEEAQRQRGAFEMHEHAVFLQDMFFLAAYLLVMGVLLHGYQVYTMREVERLRIQEKKRMETKSRLQKPKLLLLTGTAPLLLTARAGIKK